MKRKDLEIRLQSLKPFSDPDPSLEQYPTHAAIASEILFEAYAQGDIFGKRVADLGCGTGIFSIGACLLGAEEVFAFDVSESALDIARQNAEALGCQNIVFTQCDVSKVTGEYDTVLMNPPFGSQKKHADRPFIEKAVDIAGSVYSIHMECTLPFLSEFVQQHGRQVASYKKYKYDIPHTFTFHSKMRKSVDIVAVNIR